MNYIKFFKEITKEDVGLVGGKNANLGEMYQKLQSLGVRVPNGFAVTTAAYDYFIKFNNLEEKIGEILKNLNVYDLNQLQKSGEIIRNLIKQGDFPEDLKEEILKAYEELKKEYGEDLQVAVRSSASAEDLPDASFAGQQETYLNVTEKDLLEKIKFCFASLFTDRAIFYRQEKGFDHFQVKLSVGVQKMVRSDLASSGVMFTIDSDSGLDKVIVINGVFGLGELIVQGKVVPDEWIVFKYAGLNSIPEEFNLENLQLSIISKFKGEKIRKIVYGEDGGTIEVETTDEEKASYSLSDDEVLELAKMGFIIERHYQRAMDIEWAKDGIDGKIYIVQARAETVHSSKKKNVYHEYKLKEKGEILTKGIAIGSKITSGKVRVIKDVSKINEFQEGEILVTEMTDPDWVPIMKIAKGIITDRGGRTCFAGETKILTNKGFMEIREIVEKFNKEEIKVLSLNTETLKLEWKKVIDGFKRRAKVIKINISQTGRIKENFLKVTPDHKFLTFQNRKIIEKEIAKILKDSECVLSLSKIPILNVKKINSKLGYILGAIFTDGSVYLSRTHGEVEFIQKVSKEKLDFINKLSKYWVEIFGKELKKSSEKEYIGIIRGKPVRGTASSFRFYSKNLAQKFKYYFENIDKIILNSSEEFIQEFLAGLIDGDGTFYRNRICIYVSKEKILQAIIISCLRLNIPLCVSLNRNIYNVLLLDNFDEVLNYTSRVKGQSGRLKFGTIFFNAHQLLSDIIDKVNYKGRIRPYVNFNLLLDSEKIKNYIIPMVKGSVYNHELTKIIKSNLKMLRVIKDNEEEIADVYNITVDDNHNYVVFTSRYTPVIVANCHAAIVSRELGIPAIVGTQNSTEILKTGDEVTLDCTSGITGYVYKGLLDYEVIEHNLEEIPETKTKVYVNIGLPDEAWEKWYLPVKGVGLAREEFIIAEDIKIHPNALIDYPNLPENIKQKIDELTKEYEDKKQYFIDKLAEGIAKICVAYWPYEVIVRFSDFKTNEYRNLIGGELYEPHEENPMIGWRGASRYYHPKFREAFKLEVLAMKKVREEMGIKNLVMMVPFCRTPEEGRKVMDIIEEILGKREEKDYKVYVMCEIPSNVILADEFLEIFNGMSIGSNDLTQLVLGIDRDNEILQGLADERNEAVKKMISQVIKKCKEKGKYIGICGQAPSDFPEITEFLVKEGIDSISVNPDVVIKTIELVNKFENN